MNMELRDALEHICRHADPSKLDLKKDKDGMWKIGLGLVITAAEAHHVMTVMEEMEDRQLPIPDMSGNTARMGF
jgi:hypothetical protein